MELARRSGVSYSTISYLEWADRRAQRATMNALADALGVETLTLVVDPAYEEGDEKRPT